MNIVTIGGGGGHAQVLKGLKQLPNIIITGICPSTDSGGSTGTFIRDYGCLGYLGDLTKCIAALCPDEKLAAALMRRFEGGCLDGHSLKNILLLGLSQLEATSLDEALATMYRICDILPHRVVPVATERAELCAILKSGGKVNGETHIDNLAKNPLWSANVHAIQSLYLQPSVRASRQAIHALRNADHCIICPGDLYSSVIPVLLPQGMKQAIKRSKARITLILNIMTKHGETDGYHAEDILREIEARIGRPCNTILHNNALIPKASLISYREEQKIRLSSRKLKSDARLMERPLMGITPEGYLYHEPSALRETFETIFDHHPGS